MELKTLFVGNVDFGVDADELLDQFLAYGARHARVVPEKGIGFVEVPADRVQEAVDDKHDAELRGRRLRVNEARPRDPQGA